MKNHNNTKNIVLLVIYFGYFLIGSSSGFAPSRVATSFQCRGDVDLTPLQSRNRVEYLTTRTRGRDRARSLQAVSMLRGGAALSVSKPIVAKACAGLFAIKGVSLLLVPIATLKQCYKIDIEKDSLETYLLRGIGAISIGVSVNVLLSLVQGVTAQRAMGYSLLARFLYVLKSSLVGKDLVKLGGSKRFLSTNEVVMAWTTFSLLTGAGNPIVSAKVFSSLALLKGAFLTINPVAAANKFLGIDVSTDEMEKSRGLCRGLGNELTTSALLMGTLAFGIDPYKAAGYTSLLWVLLQTDMAFRDKTYLLLGLSSPGYQIASMCISLLFAAGFLAT